MFKTSKLFSRGILLVCATALLSSACVPKRVFWSPDGSKAIVLDERQEQTTAYLTDKDGKLSGPLAMQLVGPVWFTDSQRIVALAPREVGAWSELRSIISQEQAGELTARSDDLRKEILAHPGPWDDWKPQLAQELSEPELKVLWMYVRQQHGEELKAHLGPDYESLGREELTVYPIQLFRIDANRLDPGEVLAVSIEGVLSLKTSPDGTMVGWVETRKDTSEGGRLFVVHLLQNKPPQELAAFAAPGFDFSEDNRYVVYATAKNPPTNADNVVLGSIDRRKLLDENGDLVSGASSTGEPLAGSLYFSNSRVARLPGGRILFSAVSLSMPMARGDLSGGRVSLFELDPDGRATIAPMLTREAESSVPMDGFGHGVFDVRPDGRAVTIVGESGEVGYYLFASGDFEQILGNGEYRVAEQPAWRNDDELSIVVPPGHEWGSPARPELVLYSISSRQARCISRNWPDELMEQFRGQRSQTQRSQTQPSQTQPSQE